MTKFMRKHKHVVSNSIFYKWFFNGFRWGVLFSKGKFPVPDANTIPNEYFPYLLLLSQNKKFKNTVPKAWFPSVPTVKDTFVVYFWNGFLSYFMFLILAQKLLCLGCCFNRYQLFVKELYNQHQLNMICVHQNLLPKDSNKVE